MQARRIILMAFGEGKAAAVAQTVEGPVTHQVGAWGKPLIPNSQSVNPYARKRLALPDTLVESGRCAAPLVGIVDRHTGTDTPARVNSVLLLGVCAAGYAAGRCRVLGLRGHLQDPSSQAPLF